MDAEKKLEQSLEEVRHELQRKSACTCIRESESESESEQSLRHLPNTQSAILPCKVTVSVGTNTDCSASASTAAGTPTGLVDGVEFERALGEMRARYMQVLANMKAQVVQHVASTNIHAAQVVRREVYRGKTSIRAMCQRCLTQLRALLMRQEHLDKQTVLSLLDALQAGLNTRFQISQLEEDVNASLKSTSQSFGSTRTSASDAATVIMNTRGKYNSCNTLAEHSHSHSLEPLNSSTPALSRSITKPEKSHSLHVSSTISNTP